MSTESPITTFLFTDIEGSTRLWEREPDRMRLALAEHDAVCRAAVTAHQGQLVKGTGDGIHAVFDDPLHGVLAALQLQRTLPHDDTGQSLNLRVRCGLHAGEVERRDGDFYGSAVNRAARVMSIAHGGQTLLSQAVADRVAGRLPADVALQDLGAVRLRDLSGSERVHQLLHPALRAHFPPLRSLEATPNNLAQQLDSFIGRERERAELRQQLGRTRLLTLLGMGGIGKSRLSVQLGAELLDDYPDGVWLVELAPLTDPRLVPQALASVLGVKEQPGQAVIDALLAYVQDKTLLVILDNCEHVVQACAGLAKQLLQAGAGMKVLASSRDVLQVAGETVYPVPTLGVPDSNQPLNLGALAQHESVRLFVDRATAAQASFRLTADNAAAVANICQRLDGIPLALELAAARTRALSAQAIASRLHDRFKLLVTGDQTVLPRQRTLRALIDWSFDLLSEPERVLFRRLAVFAGGWTLEAAEAVGGGDGLDASEVLDLLALLVGKSLVVMEVGGERYRMLETVRVYAAEKLDGSQQAAAARTRHLVRQVAVAETARPQLAGPEQGVWLAVLDPERENFLAAHRWSEQAADGDSLGLRLMHALRPYWINRGNLTIGLAMAVDVLGRPGLRPRNGSRCMALFGAGQTSFLMGHNDQAQRYLAECLDIARENGDSAIVARVLQPLGMTALALRDDEAASRHLHEALALAEKLGEPREVAAALNALAMLYRLQGRYDDAMPICQRAVAIFRRLGDQENIGVGLLSLSMVTLRVDGPARALPMITEAAAVARSTGSQPLLLSTLDACSALAASGRQWAEAAALYGAAQACRAQAGLLRDAADEAFVVHALGEIQRVLDPQTLAAHELRGRTIARVELMDWMSQLLTGMQPQP